MSPPLWPARVPTVYAVYGDISKKNRIKDLQKLEIHGIIGLSTGELAEAG